VERPNLGLFVLIGGFAATLFAMFALPIEDPFPGSPNRVGTQIYFSHLNQIASLLPDNVPSDSRPLTTLAAAWWQYVSLVVLGLIAVSIGIAAALPRARRLFGWISAALAAAAAGLFTVALLQTTNVVEFQRNFRSSGSAFDVAGTGIWVGYAGLGVLLLGGIITGLIRGRPLATPVPAPFGGPPPQQQPPQQQPPQPAPAGWQQSGPPPWQQAQPPNQQ